MLYVGHCSFVGRPVTRITIVLFVVSVTRLTIVWITVLHIHQVDHCLDYGATHTSC